MVDSSLEKNRGFPKNLRFFIGPYCPTTVQQGKSFICTYRLLYAKEMVCYVMYGICLVLQRGFCELFKSMC